MCFSQIIVSLHSTPVSYTHLDVYKRQILWQALYFIIFLKKNNLPHTKARNSSLTDDQKVKYASSLWDYFVFIPAFELQNSGNAGSKVYFL